MADIPNDGKVAAPAASADNNLHQEGLSAWSRYGTATFDGVCNLPAGIGHALKEDFTTIQGLEHTAMTLASSAVVGAILKTGLPEKGPAGLIASGLIGTYMLYKSFDPIKAAYHKAGQAQNMDQVHQAGKELGYIGGGLVVDTGISMGGYKLGAGFAAHALLSERFDGFANTKAEFWGAADDKVMSWRNSALNLIGKGQPTEAVNTATSFGLRSHMRVDPETNRATLLRSERAAPSNAKLIGDTDPNAQMDVTVMLKSKATDLTMDRQLLRNATGRSAYITDDTEFANKFGADQDAVAALHKFAQQNNLQVADLDVRSGEAVLSGKVSDMSKSFGTTLQDYQIGSQVLRAREGALHMDADFAQHVEAILGLDERPQATPNFIRLKDIDPEAGALASLPDEPAKGTGLIDMLHDGEEEQGLLGSKPKPKAKPFKGYYPEEVAELYNFPKGYTGKGQGVGIIELEGNLDLVDNAKYYTIHGKQVPSIDKVLTRGARLYSNDANGEITLDSQVIGRMAPDAHQMIVFGKNTDEGFVNAINRATFTKAGETPNSVISISWGDPEEKYTPQAIRSMGLAFKKAALKGISVFAASGDDLATDGAPSGKFNPDYPSSDPLVTAAGGTKLVGRDGKIISESVWHSAKDSGTGGGVSNIFGRPEWQIGVKIPDNARGNGFAGRATSDVGGVADPRTGYRIRTDGVNETTGGTSGVAPEKSALVLLVNEALAQRGMQPLGPLNPYLYAKGKAGGAGSFYNDIVKGNNAGYEATKGWDPPTGWGSINGQKFLDAVLKDRAKPNGLFVNLPITGAMPALGVDMGSDQKAGK